jgi:hypothetical protein
MVRPVAKDHLMPALSSRPKVCDTFTAVLSLGEVIVPSTSITTNCTRDIFSTRWGVGSKIS